ncbi:MAG TPA: 4-hydroxythreonine-4-phosphate dehydrogenase PdxA [Burkholderiaceae bacterium]|nr:4-hydroxythreonine-4-phosphate dehydrogenase PdxA [Burkholderiaceae bacterium]
MTAAPIAITTGEPAGIGPEVALRAAQAYARPCVLLGDRALLESTARSAGLPWPLPSPCSILHESLPHAVVPGRPHAANAGYVLKLLDRAVLGCRSGAFAAMATAPVNKAVINEAGIAFSGHTEYLASATGAPFVVMMLVGGGLRVALATTHLPLASVAAAITRETVDRTLDVLDQDLRSRFAIPRPHIAVAGLNPHAGESGYLGREEIEVIAPAITAARQRGIDADGPWPADTLFVPARAGTVDAIVAMYHDQGLPPLKYASFGHGVNVTLGLPLVRTSVDHGTALDLAGTGRADPGSMLAAIELAAQLAANQASAASRPSRSPEGRGPESPLSRLRERGGGEGFSHVDAGRNL